MNAYDMYKQMHLLKIVEPTRNQSVVHSPRLVNITLNPKDKDKHITQPYFFYVDGISSLPYAVFYQQHVIWFCTMKSGDYGDAYLASACVM